jgi:hypothetical protein
LFFSRGRGRRRRRREENGFLFVITTNAKALFKEFT